MNITEPITPPVAPFRAAPQSAGGHNASPSASEHPTCREMLTETIPLIGAIAGYGPPVIFLAGPWLFFGLIMGGPLAWLFALVAVMIVAATILAALTAAILAAPFLLIRRLRRHPARQAFSNDHAVRLVPVESPRVAG
jgi:hypothetical protein